MEVDLDVADAPSKSVSTDASNQDVKPAEFVTTHDAINMTHNPPMTESSAQDVGSEEFLPDSKQHLGHKMLYPRY